MNTRGFSVGWFGIPGGQASRSTKTHVVYANKLLCGSTIHKDAEFQWCSLRLRVDYIECKNCLNTRLVKKYIEAKADMWREYRRKICG